MARFSEEKTFKVGPTTRMDAKNHEKLLAHIHERLNNSRRVRDNLEQRFVEIDRDLAGWLKLSKEDRERVRDNLRKGTLKLTDVNLQLADAQLDEEVTYLMSVFAPDTTMFEGADARNKQPAVKAFSILLNQHATRAQYYRAYARAFVDMLKYNIGGFRVEWTTQHGNKVVSDEATGNPKIQQEIVWQGNLITPLDMYNTLWDTNVSPVEVPTRGEFSATVELISLHTLNMLKRDKQIFSDEKFDKLKNASAEARYYKQKPTIRIDYSGDENTTDWVAVMSQNMASDAGACFELVNYVGYINPDDFGLTSSVENRKSKWEIWDIKILNGSIILAAKPMSNAHGMLPFVFGMPLEDGLGLQARSYAEKLVPLQKFASFLMNVYQRSARKALYGLTVYNPDVVDLNNQDVDYAGLVRVTPTGADQDVRKAITSFNETPPVQNTLQDMAQLMDLMQSLLPTNVTQQVAGLERATQYQAAATVQGTNRRSHKMARLLHSQCFTLLNAMLITNIYEYQPFVVLTDPNTGEQVEINPRSLRDSKIEFSISDGLKGIDRLMLVENYKQLLGMIVQVPDAARQIDLMGVINYISTLSGDQFDLNQFKFQNPFDLLTVDQKNAAYQLLQQFAAEQQQAEQPGQSGPGGI